MRVDLLILQQSFIILGAYDGTLEVFTGLEDRWWAPQ